MQSDTDEILLQLADSILEQQRIICELGRNDLLLIESIRAPGVSSEALAAAAQTVRSTLCSVDALGDKLHALAAKARNP
jgi:hypothetical protein